MNVDGEQGRSVALTFDNSTAVRGLVESRRARRGGGRDVSAYISCPSLGHGSIQDARILAYTLLAAADAAEHHIESMLEEQRPSRPGTPRAV